MRATALVGLVSAGSGSAEDRLGIDAILATGSEEARVALARAIAAQPASAFEHALHRLADGPEEPVQAQAAVAMGRLQSPRFLPALLPLLALRDVRSAARDGAQLGDATKACVKRAPCLAMRSMCGVRTCVEPNTVESR